MQITYKKISTNKIRFVIYNNMKKFLVLLVIFIYPKNYSFADESLTGLKIPRFVSTKTDESNLRVGAEKKYPKILTYNHKNFPLEIIGEYYDWRKTRDFEGNVGWLHKRLLKGNRYAIINSPYEEPVQILNKPEGKILGKIGKRNIVKVNRCLKKWCYILYEKKKGWITKNNLWGTYDDEVFNIPFYQFFIRLYWKLI